MCVNVYIYNYICIYVCVYVYIYTLMYIYTVYKIRNYTAKHQIPWTWQQQNTDIYIWFI